MKGHRFICYYDEEPRDDEHQVYWYSFTVVPLVKCYVFERKLFANNFDDMVFKSSCLAKQLSCELRKRVLWLGVR